MTKAHIPGQKGTGYNSDEEVYAAAKVCDTSARAQKLLIDGVPVLASRLPTALLATRANRTRTMTRGRGAPSRFHSWTTRRSTTRTSTATSTPRIRRLLPCPRTRWSPTAGRSR